MIQSFFIFITKCIYRLLFIVGIAFLSDLYTDSIIDNAPHPQRNEIIGTYQADDGAMIILQEDSTIIFLNVDWNKMFNTQKTSYLPEEITKWNFSSQYPNEYRNQYAIEAELSGAPWGLQTCVLFIEGENKWGYYPPWNLLYAEPKGIDELAYCFRRIK